MSLIYDLARLAKSGLKAQQAAQRDWSPYLVHFTSYSAMEPIRKLLKNTSMCSATDVSRALDVADAKSWEVVRSILSSPAQELQKHSPQASEGIPDCVCLSQCSFPGLFGHSERFGRFGFVFNKLDIFNLGGRPCAYIDSAIYGWLDAMHDKDATAGALWRTTNVYRPAKTGKVQDFTVEREWRLFDDLPFKEYIQATIAPDCYRDVFQDLLHSQGLNVPVLPIDMLYDWGV